MEGINLNLVSHIMLLVESEYGTHFSERKRARERAEQGGKKRARDRLTSESMMTNTSIWMECALLFLPQHINQIICVSLLRK